MSFDFVSLGDLTINHDTKRKPVKGPDRRPGPYPYYGASGIVDYVDAHIFDGEYLLIAEDGENLRTKQLPIAFMAKGKFWVNNHAHIVTGNNRASTRYLMYALLATDISAYLTGAVMPKLTQGNLNRILVPCPSLDVQNNIVSILGSIDDRIALLRETNATLEAIAQVLFKSWFVDFDPVHANAGTQAPSLSPEIQALFPATFTDTPQGPIPVGWSVKACQEIIDVRDGTHASPKPSETGYPLVTSRHITSGELSLDDTYLISEAEFLDISKRSKVDHLDVLLTMIGTVGIPAFVLSESTNFAIKNIGLFKTSKRPDFSAYIYLLLKSKEMQNYLHARMAGTTQKYLSLKALREIAIIEPSPEIIKAFSENIQPIFEGIQNNRVQVQALTDLRDTLLPRLISGQLRLPEAEQAIAAITD